MKFEYKLIENKRFNCFILNVAHVHGDADVTTYTEVVLHPVDPNSLEKYIVAFHVAAKIIDDRCYYGIEIPDNFEATHGKFESSYIPLERDVQAEGVPNYYATMTIQSIVYYDADGSAFSVTYTD